MARAKQKPPETPPETEAAPRVPTPIGHCGEVDVWLPPPPHAVDEEPPEPVAMGGIALTIPVCPVEPGDNRMLQVSARLRTSAEMDGLARLTKGLRARGATLANGQPVNDAAKAVRWLMQQIAVQEPADGEAGK